MYLAMIFKNCGVSQIPELYQAIFLLLIGKLQLQKCYEIDFLN